MRDIRLGDDLDDYCVRCKRIMNHAVVSVINAAPAKVRCRTCHSDHDYRHEQAPPPKVDLRKAALFAEVLKKVSPDAAVLDLVPEFPDEVAEAEVEVEAEVDLEAAALVEMEPEPEPVPEPEAEPDPVAEAPKPKTKTKAKPKPKAKAKAKAKAKGRK
jgi:outer membrane biosynthesis protein TonB